MDKEESSLVEFVDRHQTSNFFIDDFPVQWLPIASRKEDKKKIFQTIIHSIEDPYSVGSSSTEFLIQAAKACTNILWVALTYEGLHNVNDMGIDEVMRNNEMDPLKWSDDIQK